MDLQEAFDAGFVAVKTYVDDALAAQTKALPDLIRAAVAEAVAGIAPPRDGKDADPVAPEQIAGAVAAYMDANPPRAGDDGKDADPEVIREMVAEAVAALPPAEPGKDADPEVVRIMVAEAVAALPAAEPGKSFTAEDAAPLIAEEVAKAVSALPPAEPGKDADPVEVTAGVVAALEPIIAEQIAGLDVDMEKVADLIAAEVSKIPIPQDGKSVTVEDLEPVISREVAKAVEAIPPAKDGQDAAQIASFVKDHTGSLIVTLSDGRVIDTGIRDGAKGDAGRDALTLADFDTELSEDGRILTLSLDDGETKVTHELQLPVMIYRGGYKEGVEYVEGDTVTWGGSLWCAASATTEKPTEGRECWRLAARKGRDGKDAKAPA